MEAFTRLNGELHADGVPLAQIAQRMGTPVYVYSKAYFEARYRASK